MFWIILVVILFLFLCYAHKEGVKIQKKKELEKKDVQAKMKVVDVETHQNPSQQTEELEQEELEQADKFFESYKRYKKEIKKIDSIFRNDYETRRLNELQPKSHDALRQAAANGHIEAIIIVMEKSIRMFDFEAKCKNMFTTLMKMRSDDLFQKSPLYWRYNKIRIKQPIGLAYYEFFAAYFNEEWITAIETGAMFIDEKDGLLRIPNRNILDFRFRICLAVSNFKESLITEDEKLIQLSFNLLLSTLSDNEKQNGELKLDLVSEKVLIEITNKLLTGNDEFKKNENIALALAELLSLIGKEEMVDLLKILLKGNDTISKNVSRAFRMADSHAKLGNLEMMELVAFSRFSGEYNGEMISRNYELENDIFKKMAADGNKDAQEILTKLSHEDVILYLPEDEKIKPLKLKFLDGNELTVGKANLRRRQLYEGLNYQSRKCMNMFAELYVEHIKDFDNMLENNHVLASASFTKMLQWSVSLLMKHGIDEYDIGTIYNKATQDLDFTTKIPDFIKQIEIIEQTAAANGMELAYSQMTRTKFRSASISNSISGHIEAQISGSITAGVMNIGKGMIHGVGDMITKAINNSQIKGMKNQLFASEATLLEFKQAVYEICWEIGNTTFELLEQHGHINFMKQEYTLDGKIMYNGENLKEIKSEALMPKMNNNISIGNIDYAYALTLEMYRRNPGKRYLIDKVLSVSKKMDKKTDDYFEMLENYIITLSIQSGLMENGKINFDLLWE